MTEQPTSDLTIIVPSFNKERYVAQALDSVFSQKTKYRYEIIVADDHSTDHTLDIVDACRNRCPETLTILTSDCNQKLFRNVVRAYARTKSRYFCVLDPDDYWTEPDLIERSLDFLEAHPDFTIYSANTLLTREDGSQEPYIPKTVPADSDFNDLLRDDAVIGQTAGLFYRNVLFANGLPEKLTRPLRPDQERSCRGDTFRNLIHLHEGKIHFDPHCAAVYRVTADGLWQGTSELRRRVYACYQHLNADEYFDFKYDSFALSAQKAYASLRREFQELAAGAVDDAERLWALESASDIARRIGAQDPAGRRVAGQRTLRDRLYLALYTWAGRKARRRGAV